MTFTKIGKVNKIFDECHSHPHDEDGCGWAGDT